MRHLVFLCPALAFACTARDADTGPAPEGPHAIAFDGGPSCAVADAAVDEPPAAFTFEAWVKADPGVDYTGHPFVVWEGVAALWQTEDGFVVMTDTSGEVAGASYPADVMDQGLHHVAGTWDGSVMSVYVDGVRGGFSSAGVPRAPTDGTVHLGCWPAQGWNHQGTLDEIRLSSSVRYTDDYVVPTAAFTEDSETLHLWHVDEGAGTTSADAAAGDPLALTDIGWVSTSPFDE